MLATHSSKPTNCVKYIWRYFSVVSGSQIKRVLMKSLPTIGLLFTILSDLVIYMIYIYIRPPHHWNMKIPYHFCCAKTWEYNARGIRMKSPEVAVGQDFIGWTGCLHQPAVAQTPPVGLWWMIAWPFGSCATYFQTMCNAVDKVFIGDKSQTESDRIMTWCMKVGTWNLPSSSLWLLRRFLRLLQ